MPFQVAFAQKIILQLPHPLRKFQLAKFPSVQQALLAEIDVLDRRDILRWRFADSTGYHHWISLEDDTVIDNLVDC